jgi:hypothetical protein
MGLCVGVHNWGSYMRRDSSISCVKWRLYRHNGIQDIAYSSINTLFLDAACLYGWCATEICIVSSRPEFIVFCLIFRDFENLLLLWWAINFAEVQLNLEPLLD